MKVLCKDHGVRKYEYETGRFTGIDPLWEKYLGWTPYQYSGNNPIMFLDWDGFSEVKFDNPRSNMLFFKGFDEEMNQIYEEQMDKIVYPFALEALTIPFFGSKVVTKTLEAISKPINKLISKFVNKSDEVVEGVVKKSADEAVEGGVGVAKTSTSLVKTGTQWSKHSLQRLAERGVTKDMAEMAISKGQKFYDPLNKSINYVLPNGYASGKSVLIGTNPLTGEVTTVIRSSKNLINKRFVPIK